MGLPRNGVRKLAAPHQTNYEDKFGRSQPQTPAPLMMVEVCFGYHWTLFTFKVYHVTSLLALLAAPCSHLAWAPADAKAASIIDALMAADATLRLVHL